MEIFQVTMERLGMNSKRGTTILVVFSITLPILLMVTVMYQNSSFGLFEGFAKAKFLGGKAQDIPDLGFDYALSSQPHSFKNDSNTTVSMSNYNQNSILGLSEGFAKTKVLGGKAQNLTKLSGSNWSSNSQLHNFENDSNATKSKLIGSKNDSFASSNNDSFASSNNDSSQATSQKQLFDRLLAPGFNEGSCLSRFQSYLYRKSSPCKSSIFFISKLRSYEDLHRRCGPGSRSYNRAIRLLIKSTHVNRTTTMCKYIVWTATNGLGNRMLSMASTFLYAVLTNRVLLVEFGTEMEGLFCEPFLNSSWKLPMNFPYKNKFRNLQTYESLVNNDKAGQFSPSFLYLNLENIHGNDKLFNCNHSQAILQKVPVLILRSDQYFVPSLFMTPSFNKELNKMFPEKEAVFHQLGYYLFHPSNEAWGLITRFYQAYLAKADQRIGLQIRVFKSEITPYQIIMDKILACTLQHNLLPEVDEQNSIASLSKNRTSKAVLVASLYSNYSENLRTFYWTKPTVTGEIVGVYQPSHEEFQKFNNKHLMKALAEIYLLSMCDVLVTTAQSTFGYVAQSLGGLKPWILYKTVDTKVPKQPCQPAFYTEPCFHFPPKYDCKTRTKVDVTSLFSYLRPCEDLSWGVKMVNDHA